MIGSFVPLETDERGTRFMVENVTEKIFPNLKNIINYNLILLPGENDLEFSKINKNIIWCHVPAYDMPDDISIYFWDDQIRENTVAYIVQSKFHKNNLIENFNLDEDKVFILNNAFTPLNYTKKEKSNHVQFFYAGQFSRGFNTLVKAFKKIKDPDITMVIHGCTCTDCMDKYYGDEDDRLRFVGFTDKETYLQNILNSDILAYPCTFQETACIMAMECMSGGLQIISSDIGALPETTNGFATMMKDSPYEHYKIPMEEKRTIKFFTKEMKKAIKIARKGKFDPTDQINYVNNRFTWNNTEKQWIKLDNYLQSLSHTGII